MLTCSADVVVAGGAAFICWHSCERLLAEGNTVLCLDKFSSGSPDHNLRKGLAHTIGHLAHELHLLRPPVVEQLQPLAAD